MRIYAQNNPLKRMENCFQLFKNNVSWFVLLVFLSGKGSSRMFGSSVSIKQVSYESYANKFNHPQSKTKWLSQALKEGLLVFQIQGVGLRVFYRQLGRRM